MPRSVCIDATLVPGRLLFKQYIKIKVHKFGIQLYKVSCKVGYTFDSKVYVENPKDPNISTSSKIILQLMEPIFHQGRILYNNKYYSSITIAHVLLRDSHSTLRDNRKVKPEEVTKKIWIIASEREEVVVARQTRGTLSYNMQYCRYHPNNTTQRRNWQTYHNLRLQQQQILHRFICNCWTSFFEVLKYQKWLVRVFMKIFLFIFVVLDALF